MIVMYLLGNEPADSLTTPMNSTLDRHQFMVFSIGLSRPNNAFINLQIIWHG